MIQAIIATKRLEVLLWLCNSATSESAILTVAIEKNNTSQTIKAGVLGSLGPLGCYSFKKRRQYPFIHH